MLILQLFIFALLFLGFGIFSFFKKKKIIGLTFTLLGFVLITLGIIVIYFYPQTRPF